MTATAVKPTGKEAPQVPPLDFAIASEYSTMQSFTFAQAALGAALTNLNPQSIAPMGYLHGILLRIQIDELNAGANPAWTADGPWNVIQSITLRTPGGPQLIPAFGGYQLFAANLLGGFQPGFGAASDPRAGIQGVGAYTGADAFYLWVPCGIDISEAYGAIPAKAANTTYFLDIILAANATVVTGAPAPDIGVTITGTAHYFTSPDQVTELGVRQETQPPGMPIVSPWSVETPNANPGTQIIDSRAVGASIRNHILILRTAAGVRTDADWPQLMEIMFDNQVRFNLDRFEWEYLMTRWFGLMAGAKDVANGLLTGVYAIPYHALLGSQSGDPNNTRAQLVPTIDGTQVQFRGTAFGAQASNLEILTQQVSTKRQGVLYGK